MDPHFCRHYTGDGTPPSNRYCRTCPEAACDQLWRRVLSLAASNGGDPVPLPGTRAVLFPNPKNPDFVRLKVNCRWNLPKEDFLHYIATGHAGMGQRGQRSDPRASPSCTRQEPYVQAIAGLLGGTEIRRYGRCGRCRAGKPAGPRRTLIPSPGRRPAPRPAPP
ncbi:hypothetical protein [Methanoculleus sp.]|uniref:hypothetical protein n=1 Tax=Methanoculleus sp. TaxID=90427 RepID=UPI002FC9D217